MKKLRISAIFLAAVITAAGIAMPTSAQSLYYEEEHSDISVSASAMLHPFSVPEVNRISGTVFWGRICSGRIFLNWKNMPVSVNGIPGAV